MAWSDIHTPNDFRKTGLRSLANSLHHHHPKSNPSTSTVTVPAHIGKPFLGQRNSSLSTHRSSFSPSRGTRRPNPGDKTAEPRKSGLGHCNCIQPHYRDSHLRASHSELTKQPPLQQPSETSIPPPRLNSRLRNGLTR